MKKRIATLLSALLLFVGMAMAQTKVTGTVVSHEDGEPVIGASVMVEGQKTGSITTDNPKMPSYLILSDNDDSRNVIKLSYNVVYFPFLTE